MNKLKFLIFILAVIGIGVGIFFWVRSFGLKEKSNKFFNTEISTDANININKKNYECKFINSSGCMTILVNNPENIRGLKIEIKDGNQEITFENLNQRIENFRHNSFFILLAKILDSINSMDVSKIRSDIEHETFAGSVEGSAFEVTSDDSRIIEIYIKSIDARIIFE